MFEIDILNHMINTPFKKEELDNFKNLISKGPLLHVFSQKYKIARCLEAQSSFLNFEWGKSELDHLNMCVEKAKKIYSNAND